MNPTALLGSLANVGELPNNFGALQSAVWPHYIGNDDTRSILRQSLLI